MMTALIADDEPLARLHLRRLLEAQSVQIIGEAEDVPHALEMAEDLRPDALFLDIRMPGLTGMQMAAALVHLDTPPLLVFVTGFSEHAAAAYAHDAVDYLLKPVSPELLARTIVRLRGRLADRQARVGVGLAFDARAVQERSTLRRLPIRGDYSVRLVPVNDVLCAVARDKRVLVRTRDGQEHRTYYTLIYLEAALPAEEFLRIHDSALIRLDAVEELLFLGNHAYEVRLSDGTRLPVGRTRYADLRHRLGLDSLAPS